MARRPDGATPRNQFVRTRVTTPEKELVDKMRQSLSESDFVRSLIAAEAQRRGLTS